MPFRLVSTDVLSEDGPKIEKLDFYKKTLGEDRFSKMKDAITDWANKNDVHMYAYVLFLTFLAYSLLFTVHSKALLARLLVPTVSVRKHTSLAGKISRSPFLKPSTKHIWKKAKILPK
jgi:hypothetical protein